MSVWAGGRWGVGLWGEGVVLACCRGAMKYAFGFCIRSMSVLCMISSLLSVATSCCSNNHNRCPWLTTLYIASVSSTQASHSRKVRSTFYFSDAVILEQLPESNSSPFYTQVWNLSKVKTISLLFKILKDSSSCSTMASSYDRCFQAQEKTALPVMQQAKIENSERDESRVDTKKWGGGDVLSILIFEDLKLYNLIRTISLCYLKNFFGWMWPQKTFHQIIHMHIFYIQYYR